MSSSKAGSAADSAVNGTDAGGPLPARRVTDGVIITVRLTPKSGTDDVNGVERAGETQPVLRVRVRAAPEGGKANAAVAKLLADWLDEPKSAATLISGAKSRLKQILIRGEPEALMEKLRIRIASLGSGNRA
jgi:uncharacterized protein